MKTLDDKDPRLQDVSVVPGVTHKTGIPIAAAIIGGALGMVAVAAVLFLISLTAAIKNTNELINDKAALAVSAIEQRVRSQLEPARAQVEYVAGLIESGTVEIERERKLAGTLLGSLAAAPQVAFIAFFRPDGSYIAAGAATNNRIVTGTAHAESDVMTVLEEMRTAEGAVWGEPFYEAELNSSFLNLRAPVWSDGEYLGGLVASISIRDLSAFLGRLDIGEESSVPFILYDRDFVLAHESLEFGVWGVSETQPLPALADFQDSVIRLFWDPEAAQEEEQMDESGLMGRIIDVGETANIIDVREAEYIAIYRELEGYGPATMTIGVYFDLVEVGTQYRRLELAGIAGGILLLLALLMGLLFARRLSRRIRQFVQVATRIRNLDIDQAPRLPSSRLREFNEAADAMNAMVSALGWFSTYVPRTLVRRLITSGQGSALESEERGVTVLFTDVVGFTALARAMPAGEVATFLNEHFALIAKCVEDEGGTLDKYIGDAVMAFWGAPEDQPDHGLRAARAALAIGDAINSDNAARQAKGLSPVRVRIGLHSGSAVVGNIGAPGRVNYTMIGDTVNVAQRLEEFCKTLPDGADDVVIATSGETVKNLGTRFEGQSIGPHTLRGRETPVDVYLLTGVKDRAGSAAHAA